MDTAVTEVERLKALYELGILDSLPEDEFDGLVAAAAAVCDVPISSLVLVDADRNWLKAQVGLGDLREISRDTGFCSHAVLSDDLLEVPDATCDPRFADSPLVTGDSAIRFYAGAPIRLADGNRVGTVCVLDRKPRNLTQRQREVLVGLAVAASKALERRQTMKKHGELAASLAQALTALEAHRNHLRRLYEATPALMHAIDGQGIVTNVSDAWLDTLGFTREEVIGRHAAEFYTEASRHRARTVGMPAFFRDGRCRDVPYQMVAKDGRIIDILLSAYMGQDELGRAAGFATLKDVTAQKAAEARLAQSEARYRSLVEDQSEMISLATPDGELRFVNHAYARQFGMSPEEMVGLNLLDRVPASVRKEVASALAAATRETAPTLNENPVVLPDGRSRLFAWTNRALRDETGAVLIHSVGRDIEDRDAAARRLRDSEARFRLLSESAPLGVFSATRRGACTYSNAQWRAIFGLEAETRQREPWFASLHPDDRPTAAARWAEAARGGQEIVLAVRILRDAAVRFVEVRARPKHDANGRVQGFIGTAQDVTERTAILEALGRSEDNLRRLYESTPAMLHSIDPEGRLLMVSDLWLSKLGYRREEVIGRRSVEFFTAESRARAMHEVPAFFERGSSDGIAYQMVARGGTLIDVLMSARLDRSPDGSVVRSLTVIEDITARLKTERALQDSEARYRSLAEATSDVITQIDMNLVRRYVSPASRLMLGYAPEEMIGRDPRDVIHPDDAAAVDTVFRQLVSGGVPDDRAMVTYRKRHREGHWVWLEVGLNLVRDPDDGTPRHIICALRDVSERRRVAEELEAARAAAERAARGKAEFLANMSHELRTPLTGLLGIHELMMQEPDLAPHHRQRIGLAHEAGHALMSVINDVLDYSKIEAGELAIESVPFDVAALVHGCRDFARQAAIQKGLKLEATTPSDLTLLGDPTRLRQVLLNLASNAVKFTAQGHVTIVARYDAVGERLRLAVSDTGIGIPIDQRAVIFERFRQADGSTTRKFGGSGLGLSICRHLVALMGGTIAVESHPGLGSTFTVELPAVRAALETAASPAGTAFRAAVPRRLLLAEDHALNRSIIEAMLTRAGHRVVAVENGAEAVSRLADDPEFDLVLMDIQMPVLDGFSATRAIRAREGLVRRLPIIGLTANATAEDGRHCAEAGMDAHVAKPVDWAVLLARIEDLCSATRGASATTPAAPAPDDVLDRASLAALAEIIGSVRLAEMLQAFVAELRSHLSALSHMDEAAVAGCAHGWISMAGHFGFTELQTSATAVQADTRTGRGLIRLAALTAAVERAVIAAEASDYARAA